MSTDAWMTATVLTAMLGLLIGTRMAPDLLMLGALTMLLVLPAPGESGWRVGVIDPADALSGFSNPALFTIGALFVIAAGLRQTGAVDWLAERALGRPRTAAAAQLRLMAPVIAISAFLNNTAVVAMLVPAVADWSRRLGLSASRLMLPLSYAAILGGTCTLIGTSTNLVVSGLVVAETDLPAPSMFQITLVGLAFIGLLGRRLLPDRPSVMSQLEDPREYTVEMLVEPDGHLVGRSIEAAGLRSVPGLYLVEIERAGQILPAPGPEQRLVGGDRLTFAGVVQSVQDLQRLRGLTLATDQIFKLDTPRHQRSLIEAVVSDSCPLAGRSVRQGRFRNVYNAAIIAVARNGARLRQRIGDIVIRPGDTLLLEANPSFFDQQRNSRDFYLVSRVGEFVRPDRERAGLAVLILVLMVAAVAAGWLSMLAGTMAAATLMLVTRCCQVEATRRTIDWSVLLVVAAGLGLGRALDSTGAAAAAGETFVAAAGDHPWLVLIAVYTITSVLTEFISNGAAVSLVFPIAMTAANALGVNATPFVMVIMIAGSASFATPLGYQTNLMVYGAGGYRGVDYVRIGLPLNILVGITAVVLTPLIWPF